MAKDYTVGRVVVRDNNNARFPCELVTQLAGRKLPQLVKTKECRVALMSLAIVSFGAVPAAMVASGWAIYFGNKLSVTASSKYLKTDKTKQALAGTALALCGAISMIVTPISSIAQNYTFEKRAQKKLAVELQDEKVGISIETAFKKPLGLIGWSKDSAWCGAQKTGQSLGGQYFIVRPTKDCAGDKVRMYNKSNLKL